MQLQVGVPAAVPAVEHEAEGASLEPLLVFLSAHKSIQHVKMHLGMCGVRFKEASSPAKRQSLRSVLLGILRAPGK